MRFIHVATCRAKCSDGGGWSGVGERGEQGKRGAGNGRVDRWRAEHIRIFVFFAKTSEMQASVADTQRVEGGWRTSETQASVAAI